MRCILFDLETSPLLGYTFGLYEQNVIHVVRDSFLLSFAYKELDIDGVVCKSLRDYPLYKRDKYNDKELVKDLHHVLESADILVAHNGDGFDIKVANARFIRNGLEPISDKISIDTLKEARKKFRFTSNKLTDLAQYAGIGKKLDNEKGLWIKCINGDIKAWREMEKYNIQDVRLLEGIYKWLRPWMKSHPNINVLNGTVLSCPKCGSSKVKKNGFTYTRAGKFQSYQCFECRGRPTGKVNLLKNKPFIK